MVVKEISGDCPAIDITEARSGRVGADICVAVCTRDRVKQLRRALRSLVEQAVPPAEILVVDNAPRNDCTRVLVGEEFPSVRYVRELVLGLDFARNRALREAQSEIVAFLDDDAVADRGWVESMQKAFLEHPRAGVCTGRIDALSVETEAQRAFEANGGLMAQGSERLRLPADARRQVWRWRYAPSIAWAASLGSGCNLAVRRTFAIQIGGFDEALDLGPALPGGGDNDMVWRMLEAGAEVVYEPAARVRHEHRRDLGAIFDQIVGHQRALIALVSKAAVRSRGARRLPVLAFLCWRLVKPGVRLLRRAAGRDPLPAAVLLRVWWHCWRGLGAYSAARRVAWRRVSEAGRSRCALPLEMG
ncbi:MAG: glycosyltransferase family 2 protein [Candidatus Binatia bacterium]